MNKIILITLLIILLIYPNILALESNTQVNEAVDSMLDFNSDRYKKFAKCNIYGVCEFQSDGKIIRNDNLGVTYTISSSIRHISRFDNSLIFDATYTFDEYGRRLTFPTKPYNRKSFIALFGCSFAFGTGINDNETLHNNLGKELLNYHPYNYAIGGTGPNTMLALIQEGRLKKEITQKKGIFIYVLLPDHIHRVAGKLPSLSWLKDSPYFEMKDGVLIRNGSLKTGRPILTSLYLKINPYYKYLYNYIRTIPPLMPSDYNYFCSLVTESKRELLNQFPESKFLVYIYPHTIVLNPKISDCFTKNKIDFLKSKPFPNREDYYLPYDGHPNGLANKLVAKEISDYIRTNYKD